MAVADRVNCRLSPWPRPSRIASMLAIGASSLGEGRAASRLREVW